MWPGNARARRFAQVHPDVEPVGLIESPQSLFRARGQPHHFFERLGGASASVATCS